MFLLSIDCHDECKCVELDLVSLRWPTMSSCLAAPSLSTLLACQSCTLWSMEKTNGDTIHFSQRVTTNAALLPTQPKVVTNLSRRVYPVGWTKLLIKGENFKFLFILFSQNHFYTFFFAFFLPFFLYFPRNCFESEKRMVPTSDVQMPWTGISDLCRSICGLNWEEDALWNRRSQSSSPSWAARDCWLACQLGKYRRAYLYLAMVYRDTKGWTHS